MYSESNGLQVLVIIHENLFKKITLKTFCKADNNFVMYTIHTLWKFEKVFSLNLLKTNGEKFVIFML